MKHFVWYVQDFNVHKHLHFLSNLCDDRALKAIMRSFSQVQTDMEYMCLCCNTSAFKCRYRDLYSHVPFVKFLLFSCVMNGWLLGWHAAIYTVNCLYANILLFIKGNLRNSKHGAHWKCCGYRMCSRAADCASVSQDEIVPCPETLYWSLTLFQCTDIAVYQLHLFIISTSCIAHVFLCKQTF